MTEPAEQVRKWIDTIGLSGAIMHEARSFFLLENNCCTLEETERKLRGVYKSVSINVTEETNKLNECHPKVKVWLGDAEKIRVDVGLIKEEYNKLERCSFLCNCTPNLPRRYVLGKQIVEKLERINKLIDEEEKFTTYGYRPQPLPVQRKPERKTVGQKPVLKQLRKYLSDKKRDIIGVWGPGGVGKTTLLNAFNNYLIRHRGRFHIVIAIDVSNSETDVVGIQRTITERLGLPWDDTNERSRTNKIYNALLKKRFVIILDNVQSEFKLEDVGIPQPKRGSKIVLASRDQNICNSIGAHKNLIRMKTLDDAASHELFRRNLGTDALDALDTDSTIKYCVDEIIKKCGGLPLALNVIGRSIAGLSNQIEWENAMKAITTDLMDIKGMEEKLTTLKYSYDMLDESEKECFLYCTLFPEYCSIKKQQLVEYWMAEGYVPLDKPWNGYQIIKKLLSMCLLQETDSQFTVRLHSVIRDLGLRIANSENYFLVKSGTGLEKPPPAELLKDRKRISLTDNNIRGISLSTDDEITQISTVPTICNKLETLLLQNNSNFSSFCPDFFTLVPNLRVLDLFNTAIEEFPEIPQSDASIPLQYLNLSKTRIRRLPEGFSVFLKELIHLDLSATEHLESTSDNCSKLLKLRVFNAFRSHCGIRDESDLNLDSLTELWSLGIAIHTEDVLKKLKKTDPLARFTRQLSLKHCEGMESIHVADFNHMKHLEEIYIESCDNLRELMVDETREREPRLKMLTLWELGRLQSILVGSMPHHFQKLRELTIHECHKLDDISWVACLDSLDSLVLSNCDGIKQVVRREEISGGEITAQDEGESSQGRVTGDNNKGFPKLRSIVITQLKNLDSICNAMVFHCLESIRVQNCPKLRRLPISCEDNIPKLRQICGSWEWWNGLEWDVQGMTENLEDFFIPYATGSE